MKLVAGHDDVITQWVEQQHGFVVVHEPREIFGVIDRDGVLRGALVTTWRNDATAELHLFGRTSNDVWKAYFAWLFKNAHRLEIVTSKRNRAIKRAAPKFGFKFEGTARDYYGLGHDGLRFYMTASHCRWIRANGITVQSA